MLEFLAVIGLLTFLFEIFAACIKVSYWFMYSMVCLTIKVFFFWVPGVWGWNPWEKEDEY